MQHLSVFLGCLWLDGLNQTWVWWTNRLGGHIELADKQPADRRDNRPAKPGDRLSCRTPGRPVAWPHPAG